MPLLPHPTPKTTYQQPTLKGSMTLIQKLQKSKEDDQGKFTSIYVAKERKSKEIISTLKVCQVKNN